MDYELWDGNDQVYVLHYNKGGYCMAFTIGGDLEHIDKMLRMFADDSSMVPIVADEFYQPMTRTLWRFIPVQEKGMYLINVVKILK